MSHESESLYKKEFTDPKFRDQFNTREKQAAYYWQRSKEYYSGGIHETVSDVLGYTCHVICITNGSGSPITRLLEDFEGKIIANGAKPRNKKRPQSKVTDNIIQLRK